ncbi:DUF1217 domain-containing protein [Neotabrizicola shimadae]|uniref:DUF1217 domain-containing protein n=1 Tax=Neotabrizicola shimadae TaxID=2807096 RepID=A0A8G0ZXN3_9RHOB|nr:DUF1217 domain-containing protein [Neotabrizicola shimadae]QYZ69954.1 DUF1217 domain-containing protein [Neotabrizicola shimadae]
MSFSALLPSTGYSGWVYLQRTADSQMSRLSADAAFRREEAHFREKIAGIDTAEELVADRQLLKVALGAFGLGADLPNVYFIRKVLEDGTLSVDALSTKLADKTYASLSSEFGFGDFATPRTKLSDFADGLIEKYRARRFEEAVGEQDESLRLALNADRELTALAKKSNSVDSKWYAILGNTALRKVFETAFSLPTSFGSIDLDQQLSVMKQKAEDLLGSEDPASLADESSREALIRRFLVMDETASLRQAQSQSGAVQLLSQTVSFLRDLRDN